MSEQHPSQDEQGTKQPTAGKEGVDLQALTAAVERLLRHDLEIERERLFGARHS